jgi:hypothetical protein
VSEPVWQPQPRQKIALSSPAFELFFGGAAGGGKSDFLLMDFTRGLVHGTGHRGVIFRRTYKELEELIRRSQALYPEIGGEYMRTEKTWTFRGGATLKFRHLERGADAHDYQGHQYTWVGFDELTNWADDYAYNFLMSRVRSPEGLPTCMRAAGNPGGVGHQWVKARFIDGKEPEKIYVNKETQQSMVFIPSKIQDNQILLQNDPEYVNRLNMLPEYLRRAYLDGDWDIFAGQVFEEWRYERHVVKPFPIDPSWRRFASLDWGFQRPFSIGWWAVDGDGRMIRYREWYGADHAKRNTGLRMAAEEVAAKAFELSVAEGVDTMVADPAIWSKQDAVPSIADIFSRHGWNMVKGDNQRVAGLQRMHDLMLTDGFDGKPMMLVFSTCVHFIRTIVNLVADEKHPEDVDTTGEDHIYDEARYACMYTGARPKRERPDKIYHDAFERINEYEEYRPF